MSKSRLKNSFEKIDRVINSCSAVTTADPPLKVIGRDEERDKIIAMLHEKECDGQQNSNSDRCYSVIGIHGIAGSGKSTLAQYMCAHEKKDKEEEKDGHFDLVIWIHVSQKFDLDGIFRDMLEGAAGKACPQFNSRSALVENLKDKLRGKRIFLVLDDVWYNIRNGRQQLAEVQQVLSPLMVGMTGSKVLVTSRTKDALLALGAVEERCIPISELAENVFLQMFMHYALGGVRLAGHDRIKLAVQTLNQLINLRRVISLGGLEFPNVGKLTRLQELRDFRVKKEHGYELRQLKDLNKLQGKLQIRGLLNVGSKDEAIEASLADKEQLAELVLSWDDGISSCRDDGSCSPEVQAAGA
jgi:hypothetical protein